MNKDILKEYFQQQKSVDLNPRNEFKEELIKSLNSRIYRLEKRHRYYNILLMILACGTSIGLIGIYLSTLDISLPTIDIPPLTIEIPPIYTLLMVLLFAIIFIVSYRINVLKLRKLRRQLGIIE